MKKKLRRLRSIGVGMAVIVLIRLVKLLGWVTLALVWVSRKLTKLIHRLLDSQMSQTGDDT